MLRTNDTAYCKGNLYICNLQLQQMQDEESEVDYVSQSYRYDSRPYEQIDYRQLIRNALISYQDINDDDFILLAENVDASFTLSDASIQYNRHTLVPIGANFQVNIPSMMTEVAYRAKSSEMMRTLKILKANDPVEGALFGQEIQFVNQYLGPERSYEDVNILHNSYKKLSSQLTFKEYLIKNLKHWEFYFRNKEKSNVPKAQIKKKKKKGTIPI